MEDRAQAHDVHQIDPHRGAAAVALANCRYSGIAPHFRCALTRAAAARAAAFAGRYAGAAGLRGAGGFPRRNQNLPGNLKS